MKKLLLLTFICLSLPFSSVKPMKVNKMKVDKFIEIIQNDNPEEINNANSGFFNVLKNFFCSVFRPTTNPILEDNERKLTSLPTTNPILEDNEHKLTSLHLACSHDKTNIALYLIKKYPSLITQEDAYGNVPFHFSCEKNNMKLIQAFVDKNPSLIILKDAKKQTPLSKAVKENNTPLIKLFTQKTPVLISLKDQTGNALFHYIYENENVELVKDLMDKDPSVITLEDANNQTPLHDAFRHNKIPFIKMFTKKDPSLISREDINGDTPLHFTVRNKNTRLFQSLMNRDANIFAENKAGSSPLLEACTNEAYEIVKHIISEMPHLLFHVLENNHHPEEIIAYCLNNQLIDVNTQDENGWTLLHHACSEQLFNPNLIAFLLFIHNADLSIKNNDEQNPIEVLSSHSKEKARLLAMYRAQYDFLHEIEDEDNDFGCPTCGEDNDDAIVFVTGCCKQRYHLRCHNEWIEKKIKEEKNPGECGYCRQEVALLPEKGRFYFNANFINKLKENPNYLYTKKSC